MRTINTDVLVIGAGPAGLTASALLAGAGVNAVTVTKSASTANSPRAHITNQRTVQVFRDLGIEDEVRAFATPNDLMGNNVAGLRRAVSFAALGVRHTLGLKVRSRSGGAMAGNSRMTVAVHALCWLALAERTGVESLTSEQIAASLQSNPVAVRRALAPMRDAHLVSADLGPGGGWSLAKPADRITLAEIHLALAEPQRFALHPHEPNQECPVGFGIRDVLADVYADVEAVVTRQLDGCSVAEVLDTVLREHPVPFEWAGVPTR